MHNNPFRTALLAVALLSVVASFVLLLIASNIGSPYDEETYRIAMRAPVYAWAAGAFGLGITSMLLWLHASAISWAAEHPSPPPAVELQDVG
jgi:hypothetical protein